MTLPVFAIDPRALDADVIEVDGVEGHHATVVRRIRAGERILLTDGCGRGAECVARSTGKGTLVAEVLARRVEAEASPRVIVVQALVKGDSGEHAVDLLTQVGVDAVVPWAAARSVVSWGGERGERALRRWRGAAREAGKQARRLRFPVVEPLHSTAEVSRVLAAAASAVVLHEAAAVPIANAPVPADGDLAIVVGPEGGLTDDELAGFADVGALPVLLGPSVLRASAAGAVASAVLLSRSSRWA
jgi:16S rRNA (uracil1498-N3)-methyltransferase